MNNKKIMQTTIVVTAILLIGKVSGFLRDVALAYAYGTSDISDAFVLSISITQIFSIVFLAITIAFTPTDKEMACLCRREERKTFLDSVYTIFGISSCVVTVICVAFMDTVVGFFAPGFKENAYETAITIAEIMAVTIPLAFFILLGGQQLRNENSFIIPAIIVVPFNTILIFSFIFINPLFGINGVAVSYVAATLMQFVIIFFCLRRKGYQYKINFDVHNKGLKRIVILTFPIMTGNAIQAINTVVDRILASGLAEGSLAALNFSNKLALFVINLISLGAGNVCYTKMSELGAEGKNKELADFLKSVINILNIIVVPATVGMMVLSVPIIQTVFEYGAFDSSSSQLTATALYFYALGLVGYSLRDIITRAFYALQDSKTPMINGIVSVMVNITLNIILVRIMGIGGLALATSVSAVVGTLLLLISWRRKLGHIGAKEMVTTFIKVCIAAAIIGIVCHVGYDWLYGLTGIVPVALMLDICIGVLVYGILILFMRIREVDFVIGYVRRKIRK